MRIEVRKRLIWAMLTVIICCMTVLPIKAQTGSWHAYMAYYEIQQIVKGNNRLYVRASDNLYSYNLNDHSITTYDRVNVLNDTKINRITWNPTVNKLLVLYNNFNIDLLSQDDETFNISSYYTFNTTYEKTINTAYIYQQYAFLGTAFGVIKLDMKRQEISATYILKKFIKNIAIADNKIYVRDSSGTVSAAALNGNLIDPSSWTATTAYNPDIFNVSNEDWNNYYATVQTLQPGGPKYNHFGFLRYKNGILYTCDGGLKQAQQVDFEYPATIQTLNSSHEWSFYQDDVKGKFPGTESGSWSFVDMMSVDVDPRNAGHVFGGSRTGLFEFIDGKCVNYYYPDNSILARATTSNRYVKVESVLYDAEGNLYMTQSSTTNALLLLTKDGEWKNLTRSEWLSNGKSLGSLQGLFLDSRGLLWFVNNMYDKPSFYCYDPASNKIIQNYTTFTNQDGISYGEETYYPRSITEDRDGNIWIGTSIGVFLLENANIYNTGTNLLQIKVPRNDGTDLADYLLANANISCIAIDGANRKWIGTMGSGVYLISADNMTEVHHFTFENSPLLSNTIESIAINSATGEVYFGTTNGLCSYMSDATDSAVELVKNDVYAFPNPVPSNYNGLITVRGLTYDADVKILSVDGRLVAQGRSNGGTFTWNGRDFSGRRVASGVYMIAVATSEGKSGVVAKVAIVK